MFRLSLFSLLGLAAALHGETGHEAWLRYATLDGASLDQARQAVPAVVSVLDQSPVAASARAELIRGLKGILGRTPRAESTMPRESAILVGTVEEVRRAAPV